MQKIKLKRMPKSALLIIIEGFAAASDERERERERKSASAQFFSFSAGAEVIIFRDVARSSLRHLRNCNFMPKKHSVAGFCL